MPSEELEEEEYNNQQAHRGGHTRGGGGGGGGISEKVPSWWGWYVEYGTYAVYAAWIIWNCFFILEDVSDKNAKRLRKHLHRPWRLFSGSSRGIDQADYQWRDLVANFPILSVALGLFVLVSRSFRAKFNPAGGETGIRRQSLLYVVVGTAFVIHMHGAGVVFMFAIYGLNYVFAKHAPKYLSYSQFMAVLWLSNIAILFLNDRFKGYRFATMFKTLEWLDAPDAQGSLRWYVLFNFSTLRMISFSYDCYDALYSSTLSTSSSAAASLDSRGAATTQLPHHQQAHNHKRRTELEHKHTMHCLECALHSSRDGGGSSGGGGVVSGGGVNPHHHHPCYRLRADVPRALHEYNYWSYMAFMLYFPLYIAGPMSSYNAFVSHMNTPQRWFGPREAARYAFRIFCLFMCESFLLHFNHINAIRRYPDIISGMSKTQLAAFGIFTLAFLWMKFSVLWKSMRLFALLDGVEVLEDMNRCFCNSFTVTDFWRDWHASFNAWIVRYMYVPLGGARRKHLIIFPIFVFIAMWHDIRMQLFAWAMIMATSMVPEALVQGYFYSQRLAWLRSKPYWRVVRAIGGTTSVLCLIAANLVGYGIGIQHTKQGVDNVVSLSDLPFFLICVVALFCAASISLAERTSTQRKREALMAQYGILGGGGGGGGVVGSSKPKPSPSTVV